MRARSLWRASTNFRVTADWVSFPGARDRACGYLATPLGCMLFGAIVTAPGEFGVGDHRQEEARRLAAEGFIVLAINHDERRRPASGDETADLHAGFDYLAQRLDVDADCIGALGYGLGGAVVLTWAARSSRLACAVVVSAPIQALDDHSDEPPLVRRIKCPTQLHFGDDDEALALERTLALKRTFECEIAQPVELYTYPGARGGYEDFTGDRHWPEADALTYRRMTAFFRRHLGNWSAA